MTIFGINFKTILAQVERLRLRIPNFSRDTIPSLTLRQSVLLTLSIIFVVVLTAVAIGVSFFVTNSEKSAWHDRQLEATYGAARAIEAFLDHHMQSLESLGAIEPDYLQAHPELFDHLMAQNPAVEEILIVDAQGNKLVGSEREPLIMAHPHLIRESASFLQIRPGETYLGDVDLSQADTPYVTLAVPVQEGRVVAAHVNMQILREVVSSVRFGETGIAFIIDEDGNVIAHNSLLLTLGELRLGVSPLHMEDSSAPVFAMSDERKGIIHWHSHYENFVGTPVASLIMLLPGTEWYVVAEVDVAETSAVNRMALMVLGSAILAFGAFVLYSTARVLDQRLFRPIALLGIGAQRVGAGDLEHRIEAVGHHEITQVSNAFNEMATHLHSRQEQLVAQTDALNQEVEQRRVAQVALQQARDELEAKVGERTHELYSANQQLQKELEQNRQSQEALAIAEARLQHLLLTGPAIIFSIRLDKGTSVSYISNNITDATGYTPEDYYANPNFSSLYIHPDDMPKVNEQLARLKTMGRASYEYRFRVSSGEYKWFHDDTVAVYDEVGQVLEIVGSVIDIDERKRIEAEQAAARDHALEASRLKSEFLATVSHEIRTPLNGVIGMADLLLATPLNAQQSEFVETITDSANSLLVVIDDVLDLSKVEAGKLTLLETEFSPLRVTQSVIDLLMPRTREKGIALRAELATDVPVWVRGYEARLRQVLLNLVGNAVKFTEQGGVTVIVDILTVETASFLMRFTVSDTGIGVDKVNETKLFQPFSQVDSSLARKYGGAGLGLAISKRLVELMGGEIGVESETGKGSNFWFMVPLKIAEKAPLVKGSNSLSLIPPLPDIPLHDISLHKNSEVKGNSVVTTALQVESQLLQDEASPIILLVEDNQVNQKVATAQLKRIGYSVHTVNNGREAVEAVKRHHYSVILMDCQMPEMDGFEATRLIRSLEDEASRHVPIIAMTANAMNGDREACLRAGMSDYLAKPVRLEELRTLLALWIRELD